MLESLTTKQKIIFFSILSIMIIFIIYYIYSTINNNEYNYITNTFDTNTLINNNSETENLSNNQNNNTIIVYVCGCVKESKIVSLTEGSRISDAIDAAGGLTNEADLTTINLAYILEDGEKIYIPKIGEEINLSQETLNQANLQSSKNQKININKATQTELETIPGIGPSTALKIIDYIKENGKFNSIEEIKNVSGIGDAKYEQMKSYICVK